MKDGKNITILKKKKKSRIQKPLRSPTLNLFKGEGGKGENLAFIGPPKMTVQDVD